MRAQCPIPSNGARQPEPFPFFRAEAGSNAIVLCRYRSATAGNCLIGYFAASSFMGSAGAAREWNPGQIRFAGMAIDPSTHSPRRCLSLRLRQGIGPFRPMPRKAPALPLA